MVDILGADNDQHKHAYYSPGYAATKPYNNLSIRRVYIVTGRYNKTKDSNDYDNGGVNFNNMI